MNTFPPVIIERLLSAPLQTVFEAWTDPAKIAKWFGPPGGTIERCEVNAQVGGAYEITMLSMDEVYEVYGQFTKIESPTLIEFTWRWKEGVMEPGETLVRVDLVPVGEATKLVLSHSRLSNETSVQAHDQGWIGTLESLAAFLLN